MHVLAARLPTQIEPACRTGIENIHKIGGRQWKCTRNHLGAQKSLTHACFVGPQDADRTVHLARLPDVLQLTMNRFSNDPWTLLTVKVR